MAIDLDKIKSDVKQVIAWSQYIEDPKVDKLIDIWAEAKKDFIDSFGGLIYEWPEKVSFELGEKERHERVIQLTHRIECEWGYSSLCKFIEEQEAGFFDNLTVSDAVGLDGKTITKGTKLVKAFRHFITNDRALFDIQNEASRLIQEDKIEGNLCISVHPLDFLSSSENNHNWRSCHSLDGEYRAGNLSYMMDSCTFICYLKTRNAVRLPNFPNEVPWNSKKWRVLMHASDDRQMIISGRQYPFESSIGINMILKDIIPRLKMFSTMTRERWSDWNNYLLNRIELTNEIEFDLDEEMIPIGSTLKPITEVFIPAEGSKQYNDVLYSSCYRPIYAFKYMHFPWGDGGISCARADTTKFHIGGFTYCMWCGEAECMTAADTMMCERCELEHGSSENELFTTCDSCGVRIYTEEAYGIGDEDLCQACYEKYTTTCERCGEICWNEDIRYHEISDTYLCYDCFNEINEV